jgi:hypothetical protein
MNTAMTCRPKPLRANGAPALLIAASLLAASPRLPARAAQETPPAPDPVGFLVRTNYHGWEQVILVSNGRVEAIIVPQVGRVMQFRLAGAEDGAFWENPELWGKLADPHSTNWANFGGDRVWPAPQVEWKDHMKHEWPPPAGFDGLPYTVKLDGFVVTLTSAVDPTYGIRVQREIRLDLNEPVMTIATTFTKVEGTSLRVAVWVVTQVKNPVAVYSLMPQPSRFREGFHLLSDDRPTHLRLGPGWLALTRDPKKGYKVGTDGGTMLWMGDNDVLRIDSPRLPLADYPDQGCSVEIYTNPDPQAYVELEALGALRRMKKGDQIGQRSTYTLLKRTELDPDLEARMLYGR